MDNKLIEMLGNARKVMNKVESGDFTTGNVDRSFTKIDGTKLESMPNNGGNYISEGEGPKGIAAKNLPKEILDLMTKHPIPQAKMPTKGFTLEDVSPLIIKNNPHQLQEVKKLNNEVDEILNNKHNYNSDMITISKSELKNTINECLLSFMTNFSSNLKENTIKETINMLIKEGKINVVKKKTN